MREEDESNIRGGWTDMDLYSTASLIMMDHPLQVKIENGQLVIRIGVKRLAECSTSDDLGALRGRKITDPKEFCEDVIREMMIEDEVGTTPLIRFFGEMEIAAFESGSLAVEV